MTNVPWNKGLSLVCDATVVVTFTKSYIKENSTEAGAAASIAEKSNYSIIKKHYIILHCNINNNHFHPLIHCKPL